jgi:hypothetical protein
MKRLFFAIALAVVFTAGPAASAVWDSYGLYAQAQGQGQKGRQGQERGGGREQRQERPDDRRERMTQDERRSLHRDLDKANRELYGGRSQK